MYKMRLQWGDRETDFVIKLGVCEASDSFSISLPQSSRENAKVDKPHTSE
jgi:hypothetical protein